MPADSTFAQNNYRPQGGDRQVLRYTSFAAHGDIVSEDNLWGNCPLVNYHLDPSIGLLYDEPFLTYDTTNDWTATHVTTGSEAVSTTVPGALTLNAGASTAHQGSQIQRLTAMFLPAAGKNIWFEAKVLVGTALTIECFIGLGDSDTTVIASGSLSLTDCIGFSSVTGDGIMLFNCANASTANTPGASTITLSITVPHFLGFYYDGTADTVQPFVDGVASGAAIATTWVPKLAIYPTLVCQSSGTTQPTMTVSALRVFQLR